MAKWCICSHALDLHDFDGKCHADECDCPEFTPSELIAAQEGYVGEE